MAQVIAGSLKDKSGTDLVFFQMTIERFTKENGKTAKETVRVQRHLPAGDSTKGSGETARATEAICSQVIKVFLQPLVESCSRASGVRLDLCLLNQQELYFKFVKKNKISGS